MDQDLIRSSSWVGGDVLRIADDEKATARMDPDGVLIEAIGQGDPKAFEILVRRYQNPLMNFITRHLRDRSLAEDLTQEVFLRIHRAAPRFQRTQAKVSTWIFHIAYNLVRTAAGRRKRQQSLRASLAAGREKSAPCPQEHYVQEEAVMAALGCLSDLQRAAMLLRAEEGLSYREIAEIMEVSVQSVESLLFRARANLKRFLDKDGLKE